MMRDQDERELNLLDGGQEHVALPSGEDVGNAEPDGIQVVSRAEVDREILALYAAGRVEDGRTRLVQTYHADVRDIVYRALAGWQGRGRVWDARDDIVHEALERIDRYLPGVLAREGIRSLGGFVWKNTYFKIKSIVAKLAALDQNERLSSGSEGEAGRHGDDATDPTTDTDPLELLEHHQKYRDFRVCRAALETLENELFDLEAEGMSLEEIGSRLGKPPATIRTWKRRALIAMRHCMRRKGWDILADALRAES